MKAAKLIAALTAFVFSASVVLATSNYEYGADEYDTVINGLSLDGAYAITTHGGGEMGYTGFHLYLMNAVTGKRIGPLEEATGFLDTGANAYAAKWSADSKSVWIVYRIDRHMPLKVVSYRMDHNRAFPLTPKPVNANAEQTEYWGQNGSGLTKSPRIFGTPKPTDDSNQ